MMDYLIFDATYFHKGGCLLNLMEAASQRIVAHLYVNKESFKETYPWFLSLKQQGLSPKVITTDGERSVLRALHLVWPQAKYQRCLYHLQHEGMRWLRSCPKTEAGKQLRELLSRLSWIKHISEREAFLGEYGQWLGRYGDFVKALPRTTVAYKDLKRTIVLINNALPDMFYYLEDNQVHATTNALEGFHSRLKADYQRHRGLTREHRISYIHWYCYFKNNVA
jgi:transposase-like protein